MTHLYRSAKGMAGVIRGAGLVVDLVAAPKEAVTFDSMMVVYADRNRRVIRNVYLVDSQKDHVVGNY